MRSVGSMFYMATASPSTYATSTSVALSLNTNGLLTVTNGILSLASTTLQNFTGLKSTTTNSTSTTFAVTGTATSTFGGGISVTTGGLTISTANCSTFSNGGKLTTDASGNVTCGNDQSGGAGSTPGGANGAVQFNSSGSFAGDENNLFWDSINKSLGIGTSSPYSMLSVAGQVVGQNFVATSTNATSTFAGNVIVGSGNLLPNSPFHVGGSVNNYLQMNVQNTSNGSSASSDIVATNDIGTDSTYYVDLGINSSSYNNPAYSIVGANDAYLYAQSAGLAIGTASSTAGVLKFHTGGTTAANERMRITADGLIGIGTTTPWATISASTTTTTPALVIDQRGTGGLMILQRAGADKFTVANNGGLTINSATTDVVKDSASTGKTSDFDYTGATLSNVTTSVSGDMYLTRGTVPNGGQGYTYSPAATTTTGTIGNGSNVIIRDNGTYLIIHGGGTNTGSEWDGMSSSMTARTVTAVGNVGAGSIAIRRADGRYLLIQGGASTATTILDPYGLTAPIAGPAVCTAATGTIAFQRDDGNYTVMCGGASTWGVYNTVTNTYTAGTGAPSSSYGPGTHAIKRPDGTFLIVVGNGTTAHQIYNPYNVATVGSMLNNPITGFPTVSQGAFSIQLLDGRFLMLTGAANGSYLYTPTETATTTNLGAGTITQHVDGGSNPLGPTVSLQDGAQALWRPDGKYLLLTSNGASPTVTNIIDPAAIGTASAFSSGPALVNGLAATSTAFMRPDGTYAILRGGSTAVDLYDAGFVVGGIAASGPLSGIYESECMSVSSLNTNSTLSWDGAGEGNVSFYVRTGNGSGSCSSATYKNIAKSGDLINPGTSDNYAQIKVVFQRSLPQFVDQDWQARRAGLTRYTRNVLDPGIHSYTINNNNLYKRTNFTFGNATSSPSGPVLVNLVNKTEGVGLAYGQQSSNNEYAATVNTTSGNLHLYNGAFATSTSLQVGVASSSIVMKRPDGKFVIIAGSTTTPNAQLYDPTAETVTNLGSVPTAYGANVNIGLGALAFKRPDGKFLFILGNAANTAGSGATSTTVIFDPVANTFTQGPDLMATAGRGAFVIPLPSGRVLIAHGNFTTRTSVYDPVNNTMSPGPISTTAIGSGSVAIPRPDGTYFVVAGNSAETCTLVTTTMLFDPFQMSFRTNTGVNITTGTGAGAFAFQRNDGLYVIVHGGGTAAGCAATNRTVIYNPYNNRLIVGPTLTAIPQVGPRFEGSYAIPRPDGSWTMIVGIATVTARTLHYTEDMGAYTADMPFGKGIGTWYAGPVSPGPSSPIDGAAAGPGAIAFQRDDGKFVMIGGSAAGAVAASVSSSTAMYEFDGGWVGYGKYKSEQIYINDLDSNSVLSWKGSGFSNISAEVRTATTQLGLATATPRLVEKPGSKINPGTGEKWLQVSFNIKRSFPGYKGVYEDVWYNGATPVLTQRNIDQPTITEISVNKDTNLIDLQADGLSVFRITSNGDVYGSAQGSINTSGADLAERYTSKQELDLGEVVSIDPQNDHGVMRSKYQYQPDVVGVVSTQPGFVAGAYTENSYPIALIGRVPVKVTTENGIIHTGDFLTASSLPGYAMKATLAGKVIGKALSSVDESALMDCPNNGDFNVPGRKCGVVTVFVNLIDYNGASVDVAMDDWNSIHDQVSNISSSLGLEVATSSTASGIVLNGSTTSSVIAYGSREDKILSFLKAFKKERENGTVNKSEIFADKVSAISQIISPEIVSDLITGRSLMGDNISGLTIESKNIKTDSIDTNEITLGHKFRIRIDDSGKLGIFNVATSSNDYNSNLAISTTTDASGTPLVLDSSSTDNLATSTVVDSSTATPLFGDTPAMTIDSLGNISFGFGNGDRMTSEKMSLLANVLNSISFLYDVGASSATSTMNGTSSVPTLIASGAIKVLGKTSLSGGLSVDYIQSDSTTTVSFMSDTVFFGRPYFNEDVAGFATIKKGQKKVEVNFSREYIDQPIVNASISLEGDSDEDIDKVLNSDIKFIVAKKTVKGFTIILSKPASSDIKFSWVSLAVNGAKTFTSKDDSIVNNLSPDISSSTPNFVSTTTASSTLVSTTSETTSSTTVSSIPNVDSVTPKQSGSSVDVASTTASIVSPITSLVGKATDLISGVLNSGGVESSPTTTNTTN
jgi:hypothetical protein